MEILSSRDVRPDAGRSAAGRGWKSCEGGCGRGRREQISQLPRHGKRIGAFATGDRATVALELELAGIAELFDGVTIGTPTVPALLAAIDELGSTPELTIVVVATAGAVAAAREAEAGVVIAVARGLSSPEELRQAGAHTVVADLQELLRAVT
jgi:phosphoglycolate phosphatase-like HAD superfamily hydrolase